MALEERVQLRLLPDGREPELAEEQHLTQMKGGGRRAMSANCGSFRRRRRMRGAVVPQRQQSSSKEWAAGGSRHRVQVGVCADSVDPHPFELLGHHLGQVGPEPNALLRRSQEDLRKTGRCERRAGLCSWP